MNWYPRYPGDYMRDTAHLTLTEHGAYNVLLDHYYATKEPLPNDGAALIRICRAYEDYEKDAVKAIADKFFPVNNDGLRHNHRADKQLTEMEDKHQTLSDAGKRGMAKRWKKSGNNKADKVANNYPNKQAITYPHPHPHPHPDTTNHNQKKEIRDSSEPKIDSKPPVIYIPIVGNDNGYPISQEYATELSALYPSVDIEQTLREIRGWNLANPKRRKTKSGVLRHVNAWMNKEQNK